MPSVPTTILLSGERGVGKTTTCLRLRARALGLDRSCAGVLTLPLIDRNGRRLGLDLFDAGSGERRRLASCVESLAGPRVGPYSMSASAFTWGRSLVRSGLEQADLTFVDEIGPLELDQDEGFAPLRHALPKIGVGCRLLVVRPSLVERLAACWDLAGAHRAEVTLANRSRLARTLLGACFDLEPGLGDFLPGSESAIIRRGAGTSPRLPA